VRALLENILLVGAVVMSPYLAYSSARAQDTPSTGGIARDFDEETLRGLSQRISSAETFVDQPRPGQSSPEYLRENNFQQGKLCGVNAIYICLRALGSDVTYKQVADAVPVGQYGANMADLVSVARSHGLNFQALKDVSPAQLAEMRRPIIAHFNSPEVGEDGDALDHFVVLVAYDKEKKQFHQIDPSACTHMQLSDNYVARAFSGHCLALDGKPLFDAASLNMTLRYVVATIALTSILVWWLTIERRARRDRMKQAPGKAATIA
jgi:hypothetical protein